MKTVDISFNQAIKFCKVHHFADDTNLLCLSDSIRKMNKLEISRKLVKCKYNFTHCKKKTEMVIFKYKHKKFKGDLKIKLCGN